MREVGLSGAGCGKRGLTAQGSPRWAGAITRTSEDSYQLAIRNLAANVTSLRARVKKIKPRLAAPAGGKSGQTSGSRPAVERWEKQRRLQVLPQCRLDAEAGRASGTLSVCQGGSRMARNRHRLESAGQSFEQWPAEWEAKRFFIGADGEKAKSWGNETIRRPPAAGPVEIKLPAPLAHLANRPHGRSRLSATVTWPYRGDGVAAPAPSGAVGYDISFDPVERCWYGDASWQLADQSIATVEEIRQGPMVAVDLNVGHLAMAVLDKSGNPIAKPTTVAAVVSAQLAQDRSGSPTEQDSLLLSG